MRGGARKGAGRKPKATALGTGRIDDPAANDGKVKPLDLLLSLMRNPDLSMADRADLAKACLPYCHPRLTPSQQNERQPDRVPLIERIKEWERRMAMAKPINLAVDHKAEPGP
jgi:hypothetical protein